MSNKKEINVLVAGGSNVGKTSVCLGLARKNIYTASSASSKLKVNKEEFSYRGQNFNLLDTPGFNNLINVSEDELKTKEVLLEGDPDIILHVANARYIFRTLITAVQLIEFGLPMVLDLNMIDEAEKFGNNVDIGKLSKMLGIEVLTTLANEGEGIDTLKRALVLPKKSELIIRYNSTIEAALTRIKEIVEPEIRFSRGLGLLILIGDSFTREWLKKRLSHDTFILIDNVASSIKGDISLMIMKSKTNFIERLIEDTVKKEDIKKVKILEQIGYLSTHPVYGIIMLGLVLVALYYFIGKLGAEFLADFADGVIFGEYINPFFNWLVGFIPNDFIQESLVGEYGMLTKGLGTAIAIILPIIVTFFFAFSFLEDLGYMPRLSVLLNKGFKRIGLNGKAILPMILGFSCVTMATISTRVLEEKKERLITIFMLVLVIPCSAKLSVIVAILAPVSIIGIIIVTVVLLLLMLFSGYISAKLIPGERSDFIIEIYPLRIPALKAILFKTYKRSKWFLEEALPFFIYGTFCLFLLNKMDVLSYLERICAPVIVDFLHLPAKFTEAYLLSFFRGEAGILVLRDMAINGELTHQQLVISVLIIILAIPCLTNLLVIIKEYGLKFGLFLVLLIMPLSIIIGGIVNAVLNVLPITI